MANNKDLKNGSQACKKASDIADNACKISRSTTETTVESTLADKKPKGFPYRPNLIGEDNRNLLSMKFINKPSRSKDLLAQASDPTRANSILNSHISNDDYTTSEGETTASSPKYEDIDNHDLVRKKSGEFLKLSLKDHNNSYFDKKRSLSLPTTPTFKQVHFGGDNDIIYFKKKDKPTAISASNSPILRGIEGGFKTIQIGSDEDDDDDDDEYEEDYRELDHDQDYFTLDLNSAGSTNFPGANSEQSVSWDLQLRNFSPLSYDNQIKVRKSPVFLERIFIRMDKKFLVGHIAVKNLAFEKSINVRYTLDKWCTIVEIPTAYVPDIPKILKTNDYDRFIFRIPLDSLFNSFRIPDNRSGGKFQEQGYSLCIKYNTGSLEFWDNNQFKNYDFKLIKTIKSAKTNTSKIQTHHTRPKYSSSYLKRRVSDSQLEVSSKKPEESIENDSSDFSNNNDFVNNDFYLLSPLLSSLSNSNYDTEFLHNYSSETLTPYKSASENFSQGLDEVYDSDHRKGNSDCKNDDDKSFTSNILDSKSYKGLLDKYCFFPTNPEDDTNSSDVYLSLSPIKDSVSTSSEKSDFLKSKAPHISGSHSTSDVSTARPVVTGETNSEPNKESNNDSNNTYTVSSILKV